MTLVQFLGSKPLFYDVIDYERFPAAYESIRSFLAIPKIIHIVGTNGKGSTGRFLATALHRAGKKIGHYTSPHIVRFNERIWMDGEEISDELLEKAHKKILGILTSEYAHTLSYFEYTTLLAMVVFEECEYVVLEAGLGGEFDATNVFDKVLSVFTPIDFDHSAFLGNTIESITTTKLRSMQRVALMGKQPFIETKIIARQIANEKKTDIKCIDGMASVKIKEHALQNAIKNGLSDYLRDNLELAMAAYEVLGYTAEKVLFDQNALFGRLTKIKDNITLDVGHNSLAARAIAEAFRGQKVVLVYNTYADKDYQEILSILAPIIESVEIIEVDETRIVARELLEGVIRDLRITYCSFQEIREDKKYLVFGSFSVAEAFLKRMKYN
ncbi:MAG: bifunctional folylpolyglutamate synthase/dihydrofolate synthase [Campylobacterales bacterium]|nr:bifunctional folylpolyglutamate synthase/dihydrofolate synthase [Campylobacterales bacterium]